MRVRCFRWYPFCSRTLANLNKKERQHNETKQHHPVSPASREFCSTSAAARVSPSAPRAPGNSSRDVATTTMNPSELPRLFSSSSHDVGLTTGFFLWPAVTKSRQPAFHFHGDHHQPGSFVDSYKLWVRTCLSFARCFQNHSIDVSCKSSRSSIAPDCTHQCCVHCKLGPSKQGKAIRHNLKPASFCGPPVKTLHIVQIEITDHDVVVTRRPDFRQILSSMLSKANLHRPRNPPSRTQLGGGHMESNDFLEVDPDAFFDDFDHHFSIHLNHHVDRPLLLGRP